MKSTTLILVGAAVFFVVGNIEIRAQPELQLQQLAAKSIAITKTYARDFTRSTPFAGPIFVDIESVQTAFGLSRGRSQDAIDEVGGTGASRASVLKHTPKLTPRLDHHGDTMFVDAGIWWIDRDGLLIWVDKVKIDGNNAVVRAHFRANEERDGVRGRATSGATIDVILEYRGKVWRHVETQTVGMS